MNQRARNIVETLLSCFEGGYRSVLQNLEFAHRMLPPEAAEIEPALSRTISNLRNSTADNSAVLLQARRELNDLLHPPQETVPSAGRRKILIKNFQALGDIAMLTVAVRDLVEQHGDKVAVGVQTGAGTIWANNPHITNLDPNDPTVEKIDAGYPSIHRSNSHPVHFVFSFHEFLSEKLGLEIRPGPWAGSIYLSSEEKASVSPVEERLGKDNVMWVINAGYKRDFTAKQWDFRRYQDLISMFPEITFVQIGIGGNPHHIHPELEGPNLINMIGKTNDRELFRVIFHSAGVITPVSCPMVLAYMIPPHPKYKRKTRACVVLAGGREPNHWQQGPSQHMLHTCGLLPCCDQGGCWKSRVTKLGDGDDKDNSLCERPVSLPNGQTIAGCMDMIKTADAARIIRAHYDSLEAYKNGLCLHSGQ